MSFGQCGGSESDKHAGVALDLNLEFFRTSDTVKVWSPEGLTRGKVGVVRTTRKLFGVTHVGSSIPQLIATAMCAIPRSTSTIFFNQQQIN